MNDIQQPKFAGRWSAWVLVGGAVAIVAAVIVAGGAASRAGVDGRTETNRPAAQGSAARAALRPASAEATLGDVLATLERFGYFVPWPRRSGDENLAGRVPGPGRSVRYLAYLWGGAAAPSIAVTAERDGSVVEVAASTRPEDVSGEQPLLGLSHAYRVRAALSAVAGFDVTDLPAPDSTLDGPAGWRVRYVNYPGEGETWILSPRAGWTVGPTIGGAPQ